MQIRTRQYIVCRDAIEAAEAGLQAVQAALSALPSEQRKAAEPLVTKVFNRAAPSNPSPYPNKFALLHRLEESVRIVRSRVVADPDTARYDVLEVIRGPVGLAAMLRHKELTRGEAAQLIEDLANVVRRELEEENAA